MTSDPYTEDFYAQVYGSLMRSRMGISTNEERVLKFGSSGEGVGLGLNQRGAGRRPNAMQRMEAQVERIVNNARQREKEKGMHGMQFSLCGFSCTSHRGSQPSTICKVHSARQLAAATRLHLVSSCKSVQTVPLILPQTAMVISLRMTRSMRRELPKKLRSAVVKPLVSHLT